MSPVGGRSGPSIRIGSIPLGWCSSMRPGPNQYGALRGWAPRGQRIKAKVPHGRWQTMTFMAALRHDRITAPWSSRGRSTAKPSFSTLRRFWSRPCGPATSSSWIISARTRPAPCGAPSVPPAPGSSTCRNTRPISTQSSSSRQVQTLAAQSRTANHRGCLRWLSGRSSRRSHRPNAPITSLRRI